MGLYVPVGGVWGQLKLQVPSTLPPSEANIKLEYPDSLQIWTASSPSVGSVVESGVAYSFAQLNGGWLYIEGLEPESEAKISLYLKSGQSFSQAEAVTVTLFEADINTDSDNDGTIAEDDDPLEDAPGLPGRLVAVNDGDVDGDGIVDWADGFNWDRAASADDLCAEGGESPTNLFAPVEITIPESVNLSIARLRICYGGSGSQNTQPVLVGRFSPQTQGEWPMYTLPSYEVMRLWTKGSNAARSFESFTVGSASTGLGYYVPPTWWDDAGNNDYYSPDDLEDLGFGESRTITLYVEALCLSSSAGDLSVEVQIDPDGPGPAGFATTDQVRLTAIEVEIMRGAVDPVSGRGAIGSAAGVLSPIGSKDLIPISNPRPQVVFDGLAVSSITQDSNYQLRTSITVSGYVTSPYADIVPGNADDPTQVRVLVGTCLVGTLPLMRVPEAPCFLRPYAARYTYSGTFSNVAVLPHDNAVVIEADDPATGNTGYDMATFKVTATNAPTAPDEDTGDPFAMPFWSRGLHHPLTMELDFGTAATLDDIIAAGNSALPFRIKPSFASDEYQVQGSSGMALQSGVPVIHGSDGSIEVEITDTSTLGLSPTQVGVFSAIIRAADFATGDVPVIFEETAPNSNLFRVRSYNIVATFTAPLNEWAVDTLSVNVQKMLWDSAGPSVSAQLVETTADSNTFGDSAFLVSIADLSGFSETMEDEMGFSLGIPGWGLSGYLVDAQEVGAGGLSFRTDHVFGETSSEQATAAIEYANAWMDGPWQAASITYGGGSEPGMYVPLAVQVLGPISPAVAATLRGTIFDNEHDLVTCDGGLFFTGSPQPGIYSVAGRLKPGPFGVGHITDKTEFVWAKLNQGVKSNNVQVDQTVRMLFDELLKVADERRQARYKREMPGKTYQTPWYVQQVDDPARNFANFLWQDFFVPVITGGQIDDAARARALLKMNENNKDPKFAVLGLPHSPNAVYARARTRSPKVLMIGSKYLLGHWQGIDEDADFDFKKQRQNITQIIHLNTGLGWGALKPNFDELFAIFTEKSGDEFKKAVVSWFDARGYLGGLPPMFRTMVKGNPAAAFDFLMQDLSKLPDIPEKPVLVNFKMKFMELVDSVRLMSAFGGTADALSVFMAYDIASEEGFQVFGIDALNDIIATDAGARLAEELSKPGAKITSVASLQESLESQMLAARKALLRHSLFSDKQTTLDAFYSVMTVMGAGGKYVPYKIAAPPSVAGAGDQIMWQATLGTICQSNADRIKKAGSAKFVQDVVTCSPKTGPAESIESPLEERGSDEAQAVQ